MDWSKTIENTTLALTVFMVIIPLFKDVIDRSDPDKPFIKKITLGGWFLIFAGALIVILNFIRQGIDEAKNNNDKTEHKKELREMRESDSSQILQTRQKILDTLGMVGISAEEIKRKLDSLRNSKMTIENPILALENAPTFKKNKNQDDFTLYFDIKNYGKGNGKYIKFKCFEIKQKTSGFTILEQLVETSKDFDFIGVGQEFSFFTTCRMKNFYRNDTIYYFIRATYKNDNNKNLPPLKMIYFIPVPNYDGQVISEISEDNFNRVKTFLIKQKLW